MRILARLEADGTRWTSTGKTKRNVSTYNFFLLHLGGIKDYGPSDDKQIPQVRKLLKPVTIGALKVLVAPTLPRGTSNLTHNRSITLLVSSIICL